MHAAQHGIRVSILELNCGDAELLKGSSDEATSNNGEEGQGIEMATV